MQAAVALAILLIAPAGASFGADLLDLTPSGQISTWTGNEVRRIGTLPSKTGASNLGVEWDEERDVREIRVHSLGAAKPGARVEYWFKNWPYEPPKMPTFEDPMDDPWQGKWLAAAVNEKCAGSDCIYSFVPLDGSENPNAGKLPGVSYRRTLKVRLVYSDAAETIQSVQVFSGTRQLPVEARVQLGVGENGSAAWSGNVTVYNGRLHSVKAGKTDVPDASGFHWAVKESRSPAVLQLGLLAAVPDLPGSHDLTVVTIHASRRDSAGEQDRSFSFSVDDLKRGPITLPDLNSRVDDPSAGTQRQAAGETKLRVRDRIPKEPEQTFERASREIPPLDPWVREWGGPVYLPLAPDSDWQKFAFEYGGNVFVSKTGIKAKGSELQRLQWDGDRITWKIGTGESPYYREDHAVTVKKLDDYLPVVTQQWEKEGIRYSEEAYSSLIGGPLSPQGRDEETPAVLMMRMTSENSTTKPARVHLWLSIDAAGALSLEGNVLKANGKFVAGLAAPEGTRYALAALPGSSGNALHITFDLQPGANSSVTFKLPCVSDLTAEDVQKLDLIDYASEREKVVGYWKHIVDPAVRFTVPEPKFNELAKTVIAQIHISTTKDPKTGLFMVPAASYVYDVFENESCYQVLLLDTLGQFDTATQYLETMMQLQGSKNFPGMQTGSYAGTFHGVKISDTYDYTHSGYGLDNGTVLWTLAQHYLYVRDRAWLQHAWPHMQKAIEWIEEQRSSTKLLTAGGEKVREYGLLPASQLEDDVDWANWFSVNAFAWAGMARTADALADIGSPDAEKVKQQAEAFRADLRTAVLRAVQSAPVARMQDGKYQPYVPVLPTRRFRLFGDIRADYYRRYPNSDIKPLLRLGADRDTLCGSVVLLILGLFSPDEPIAGWILNDWEDNETLSSGMGMNIHGVTDDRYWFSQGGMVFQANLMNPIQVYLSRHEVPAAIRNLYNDFVACLYPETVMFTEEFHQWRHGSGPFYKISDESRFVNRVRDMLVFEKEDSLWLGSGVPRRWLEAKQGVDVKQVQTFFGPVSYSMHPGSRPGVVDAIVELPENNRAKKTWLVARVPQGKIQSVTLDGKPWTSIDRKLEAIELPSGRAQMKLQIEYR